MTSMMIFGVHDWEYVMAVGMTCVIMSIERVSQKYYFTRIIRNMEL